LRSGVPLFKTDTGPEHLGSIVAQLRWAEIAGLPPEFTEMTGLMAAKR